METNNKNKLIFGIGIFLILVVLIASSYAYWQLTNTQIEENVVGSGCFDITFTENTDKISLLNAFPISDTVGLTSDPYSFTIKNICDYYALYQVNMEVLPIDGGQTRLSDEYVKVGVDNTASFLSSNESTSATIGEALKSYKLKTGGLAQGESISYNIRLWLDAYAPQASSENRVFKSKVTIIATAGKEPKFLRTAILNQGGGISSITAKGNPNFSLIPTTVTSGLYATEDEYGTSYYYRGEKDVLANNVIFAEHQWKIVRINGDGSIRLIYNGECPDNNCTIDSTEGATAINDNAYYSWNTTNNNDAKYVGYMYGGSNGEASTDKIQAQTNETSSNAKTILDNWYLSNIKNTEYEQYIADNIFCNDRSVTNGDGYGTGETYYKAYTRIYTNRPNPTPTLKCEQKNDRFTVSDTIKGNGALTYPVGTITTDEVQLGGIGYGAAGINQYLYTGKTYWTMSPANYSDGSLIWIIYSGGNQGDISVTSYFVLRAVLNLTSDAVISTGDGTVNNPYIIAT